MRFNFEAIDLFSGCGGVSCGLTLAGFKVKAAVEIEKSAVDVYSSYPPLKKVNVLCKDICELSGEEILKAAQIDQQSIYLLAGCPPCQNFSRQNPENKNKTVEERKKLLFEFLRIIEEIQPPFILMENVPGIKDEYNKVILDEFLDAVITNDVFGFVMGRNIINGWVKTKSVPIGTNCVKRLTLPSWKNPRAWTRL